MQLAVSATPSFQDEVSFINGLLPDGTNNPNSYNHTSIKWGVRQAGAGANITFSFVAASHFTDTEKSVFYLAFATWESAANVHFTEVASGGGNIALVRGTDHSAHAQFRYSSGTGSTTGSFSSQCVISIDTSVLGFDLSGSFAQSGGYGISTAIHEVGHALGLGHGGSYNGTVNPATQQYSAYDDRLWTTMSYIDYTDTNARFRPEYSVTNTYWGRTHAPHSLMLADIAAITQLYGSSNPLFSGETIGFNATITGALSNVYDFSINSNPVLTLRLGFFATLDLSGYSMAQRIELGPGAFSDIGGLRNNICISYDTDTLNLIGGKGDDTVTIVSSRFSFSATVHGNDGRDVIVAGTLGAYLYGDGGNDKITGAVGEDVLFGGDDDDVISGGDSFDELYGETGEDTLSGGAGNDFLSGGAGYDRLRGGGGSDPFHRFTDGLSRRRHG